MRLIFASLLLMLVLVPGAVAQDDVDEIPITPALSADLDGLDAATVEIRELTPITPVTRRFPTRAEVLDFVESAVDEQLTEESIFEDTMFYRAFDFVGPDFDLVAAITTLLGEQVGGYYDPDTQEMNTVLITPNASLEDGLPALETLTYVHEYTHALQDQHFDLTALQDTVPDDSPDAVLALTSLIEGDAMLVMQDYTLRLVQEDPGAVEEILGLTNAGIGEIPPETPAILENELTMPYLSGLNFAIQLRMDGGWERVNAAFDNPPVSTEQILHPERYLAGEMPVAVTLMPVDNALGDDWEPVMSRTLGEFYLGQYLQTQLATGDAADSAEGWGGDRYSLYYNPTGDQLAWVLRIAWDTPEDQIEFVKDYNTFAVARFGAPSGASCWSGEMDAACMVTVEGDVLLAVAPDQALAEALIASQSTE